jgi:hypothetical protein
MLFGQAVWSTGFSMYSPHLAVLAEQHPGQRILPRHHLVPRAPVVVAQADFERHVLKPGFFFKGKGFETRRLSAMGQGESTCTGGPTWYSPSAAASFTRTCSQTSHPRIVVVQVDPFESEI